MLNMDQPERQESFDLSRGVSQFRETFYHFLSRGFSAEADRGFLQNIPPILEAIENLSDLVDPIKVLDLNKGKDLLTRFLKDMGTDEDDDSVLEDLSRDYAGLFLGVGRDTVPLCESAYQSKSRTLFRTSYFEVKKKYQETGFSKSKDFPEPDDHLAVELAHMANLCRISIKAIEGKEKNYLAYLVLQKEFMGTHLSGWVPDFTEALLEVSDSTFYSGMAFILKGYVAIDADLIDALIDQTN